MPTKSEPKDKRTQLDSPIIQYLKSIGIHATNTMIEEIKIRIPHRKGGNPETDVKVACDSYVADGLHYARDSYNWLVAGRISFADAKGRLTEHRRNQVLDTVLPTLYASLEELERRRVEVWMSRKLFFIERSIDHVKKLIETYEDFIR